MIFKEKTKTQPISKEQVWAAWKRIRSHNSSGSGVDSVTLSMIEQEPRKYLYPVWNRLASGSYQAPAVKEVAIPKGTRSWRLLGIPTLCDRVAQDVIREELTHLVEPKFHKWSFVFRPQRSAHDALKACWFNTLQYEYVVDVDIRGYFDNIDHQLMMSVLKKYTDKSHILLYCERWLKAPVVKRDGNLETCHRINLRIINWLMRKHKEGYRRAKRRYLHLATCYPSLFVHWEYGMTG
jgi:RNA-directed DNA polymerase